MQKWGSQRREKWEYVKEAALQTRRSLEKEEEEMHRLWSRDSPAPCGEVMKSWKSAMTGQVDA